MLPAGGPRPRESPPLALVIPSSLSLRSSPERSPAAVLGPAALSRAFLEESSLRDSWKPSDASVSGTAGCFSGKLAPVSSLSSPLPPRRPSGWQDAASLRSERVPGTPPGGWFAAYPLPPRRGARPRPRRTHSRPDRRAALPPARSSHPTLSRPRHLTPPPSPAAPRTPRPGPASSSSLPNRSLASPSPPGRRNISRSALLSPHSPPRSPSPRPALSFLGEGGCRLGLKAIDLYVFVPAPEAAPAARAGAAAAASGVASLLP